MSFQAINGDVTLNGRVLREGEGRELLGFLIETYRVADTLASRDAALSLASELVQARVMASRGRDLK